MREYRFDPSLNILHNAYQNLDNLFYPKNIAVIGATDRENSIGRTIVWNLFRSPFGGTIFPVNPKRDSVLGIKAYPSIDKIPVEIDLAIIATPSSTVPGIIGQCVKKDVKSAIIISAGFKELGEPGILLEDQINSHLKNSKMRIIGPNCLGIMNTANGLNASFASDMAIKGNVAFLSQSGALCTAILDWSLKENVGFSSFISIGSMIDVDWGDLINYFGNDPNTNSILIYMESVGDSRSFLSAAKEVALTKPIILIKAGRTQESAKAASSHTGALSGSDDVFDAALKRVGVLRVDSIVDLFRMGDILAKQPKPKGPNLAIVTNAGGPGVIATDALVESGGKIAKLSKETYQQLDAVLPKAWSHNNPIDILGDAGPELYASSLEILEKDPNIDAILAILTPQYVTDATKSAHAIINANLSKQKPIFTSWMGADAVEKGIEVLNENNIPNFSYPDSACVSFSYMWSYKYNLEEIYETPSFSGDVDIDRQRQVKKIIEKARNDKREILNELESKEILKIYEIPVNDTYFAKTVTEAIKYAKKLKFPVVLKLCAKTITHKTDIGGVKLNIKDEKGVEKAFKEIVASLKSRKLEKEFVGVSVQSMIKSDGYEIIIGSSIDPQFGPVLLFGSGGQLVEVMRDSSLALPPLTTTLARRAMERTKIYQAFKGVRGRKPIDIKKLEKIFVRFSNLVVENLDIKEMDINPLIVSSDGIISVDSRVILHKKSEKFPTLAIRPYPLKYVQTWKLKDAKEVLIRPIKPEDEQLLIMFYRELSERTVKQRYLEVLQYKELATHERLIRICCSDYDREIILVVEATNSEDKKEFLAAGRMSKIIGTKNASFSLIVKDSYQHSGIGSKLVKELVGVAKSEGVERLEAHMFAENKEMISICKKMKFKILENVEEGLTLVELDIKKA
jgi:acetyltransferase